MRYEDVPSLKTWERDSAVFASPVSTGRVAAIAQAFSAPAFNKTVAKNAAAVAPGSRAGLQPIDRVIELYQKAFSPMAKTNLLNDLRREIDRWHQSRPGQLPMAMAALKDVVDRKLGLRLAASRYSHAICAAFHFHCNYDFGAGVAHANTNLNQDYFRHNTNDKLDMDAKCGELWAAIQAARDAIAVQNIADNEQTLKIFMAPEFYFRGINGAYAPDIVSAIIPKMMSLGTGGLLYKDWLFVFGTAVASIEVEETKCTQCTAPVKFVRGVDPVNHKTLATTSAKCSANAAHAVTTITKGAEVQNVALIQHGKTTHLVAKEFVSPIDYKRYSGEMQVKVHPNTPQEAMRKVLSPLGGSENPGAMPVQSDERLGGCVFTVDGITVGLEVCLDHGRSHAAWVGRARDLAPTIQILLIPSYGMKIDKTDWGYDSGMYCKNDGIVFNVDGKVNGTSEVKLKTGTNPSQTAHPVNNRVTLYGPFAIPA